MTRRPPAVAGAFYPATPAGLRDALAASFAAAVEPAPDAPVPKALVVPHAGYVYSGPVAASAYLRLRPGRERVRRVVLLGPSHRVPVRGMAVSGLDVFATPLGEVPVDAGARTRVASMPGVTVADAPHAFEHSLEVQLPFLQTVLDDFALVPLAVGDATTAEVAAVLDALWGGPETLVVVSTDLSHYHPYERARALDRRTAGAILDLDAGGVGDRDACGAHPLRGLLAVARRRGLRIELLDLRSSGDTAGDRDRVVGYGAFAIA